MKRIPSLTLTMLVVLGIVLSACSTAAPSAAPTSELPTQAPPTKAPSTAVPPPTAVEIPWTAPAGALVAYPVTVAPAIDGNASDPIWALAEETVLKAAGSGLDDFDFTMKSVYTSDSVYFLVQYPDSNKDVNRSAWAFDPVAKAWSRLSDDFGDEDEFGFWWNMTMPNYDTVGCNQGCHGDSMLAPKGTNADDWRWNAARSDPMGWGRDFIMTDNPDADPSGGFTKDEGFETNRGYVDNVQEIGGAEVPLYWKPFSGSGGISIGDPIFLLQAEIDAGIAKKIASIDPDGTLVDETGAKVPLWVHIPGRIVSLPSGPSWNDISAKGTWSDGVWTVELGRKLDTGHADDAQFNDLKATYYFDGYVKTRQPDEVGPHNSLPTTPFAFKPGEPQAPATPKVEAPANAPAGALVSYKTDAAPVIDGNGTDAVWADAKETVVPVTGAGIDDFDFTMKSIYTADSVYFLVQYPDSNKEVSRSAWAFDPAAQTWSRLADDFGDEDEFGFWWNINMAKFDTVGCGGACHGDSMLAAKGETADDWRWNAARSDPMGWGRDFIMTDNPEADPAGGFTKDEGYETNRGYVDNLQEIGGAEVPLYWKPFSGSGGVSIGDPIFLLQAEIDAGIAKKIASIDPDGTLVDETGAKVPQWVYIPGRILSLPSGPSWNDISAKGGWLNGMWTVELGRKLDTGHADDAQFNDLTATYYFDGYVKTRQPGEGGPHNSFNNVPLVFEP